MRKEMDKADKIDMLEKLLEEEIRARKALEKQVAIVTAQLAEQKRINDENNQIINALKGKLDALEGKASTEKSSD